MVRSGALMRGSLVFLLVCFAGTTAIAQPDVFFGSGQAPTYVEHDIDRRFAKSKINRGLTNGTQDQNCTQLLGGLFTLLAEAAPTFHKRDENFYLDPVLVHALNAQLTNPRFPGSAYLATMVRRVMITGKLPPGWLATANALNRTVGIIDMAKLQFIADGLKPLDSFLFTLPALQQRYELEVLRANTAARSTAVLSFRDAYLDREVAWGSLYLVDIGPPKKARGKKKKKALPEETKYLVATLQYEPPQQNPESVSATLFGSVKKEKPTRIVARLAPEQFVDIHRIPKGKRLLVRGRFWDMSDDLKRLELRDALLFEDRDWSQGALLARPEAVAMCPLAINDLAGTAPVQPGGFGMRPGQR